LRAHLDSSGRATYLSVESASVLVASLALSVLAQHRGVAAVYSCTTATKVLLGALLLVLPPNGVLGAAYLMLCILCTGGAGAFWMVLIASVADEHRVLASERRAASDTAARPAASVISLYMGVHALIAKPADSLAPVIGSAVLSSVGWTGDAMRGDVTPAVLAATYRLVALFPTVCGLLQLLAWSRFDLVGERLRYVSAKTDERAAAHVVASESQAHLGESVEVEIAPRERKPRRE
jgi:Na+/melibiose symporter-like transporter